MFDLIGGAVAVFVATNLDGFVLLTGLFATPGASGRRIVVGQYLGFAILVAISAIAAVGLVVVPTRWVGLLGAIPLALGVRALTGRDHEPRVPRINVWGVVGLVIADGADNVAVYTPVFRHLAPPAASRTRSSSACWQHSGVSSRRCSHAVDRSQRPSNAWVTSSCRSCSS